MRIAGDAPSLFLFAAMFGLLNYAVLPVMASLVASHLGIAIMGLAMGLLAAGHSFGAALGALLAGLLFDLFGQYLWVWVIAAGIAVAAAAIALTIPESRRIAPAAAAA
jgi:MFS family permease